MFEKLTTRERYLAYALVALVPVTILFIGVFGFINQYKANNQQFMNLTTQLGQQQDLQAQAMNAQQRRSYYRNISLPSDLNHASQDYQLWLKSLVRDQLKMSFKSLTPRKGADLKFNNKVVGRSQEFTLLATADLKQLTSFLEEFYSVELLHRINSLKIIPQSAGSSNGQKVRTGKLSLSIEIETVSLIDASSDKVNDRQFDRSIRALPRSRDDYEQTILRRNIFGPANNTPIVSARPSSSYTSGTDVKIQVSAKDPDENDLLEFQLLDAGVEGATLQQSADSDRSATLSIPGKSAGSYSFKILVSDNGFPPKTSETEFAVNFKDRAVPTPRPPAPPKPKFVHATETRITGIVKDVQDNWIVWIKVRTTGEQFKLKVGESFQLDDKQWTVASVEPNQAVLQVGDRMLTFEPSDPFSTPRETAQADNVKL